MLLVTAVLAFFVFATARDSLEAEIGQKLRDIARIASNDVPYARLNLIEPGAESTRMVRRLTAKLATLQQTAGVASVEVCRHDGTQLVAARGAQIGAACSHPPTTQARAALRQGESISFGTEEGGQRFMTAYAPIRDAKGVYFAGLMVRSDANAVSVVLQMQQRLLLAAGLTVIFGAFLSVLLAGWIARPIRQVAATADRIGQGRYAARVTPPSNRELARLARSINTMAEQVQQRDRRLKAMSGTVAHEIRNPLNSIGLLLTLLEEELHDAGHVDQGQTIDTLRDEIGRLDRVLNGFLTWARPIELANTPLDARQPLERAVQMAQAAASERSITVQVAAGPPVMARLDVERMEQCLLNLLLNAVHASPAGGVVEAEVMQSDERITYAVADRGPGIEPAVRARLFEPFFTTRAQGTGLGLANTRAIVEAHGGTVQLEERPGGGVCAIITVPRGDI